MSLHICTKTIYVSLISIDPSHKYGSVNVFDFKEKKNCIILAVFYKKKKKNVYIT